LKAVIDTQGICGLNRERGIGRFGRALLEAMLEKFDAEDKAVLLAHDGLAHADFRADTKSVFLPLHTQYRAQSSRFKYRTAEKIVKNAVDAMDADLFLVISLFEGFADDCVCVFSENSINAVVLYDLIPLVMQDVYLNNTVMREWYFEKLEVLKKADLILCISEYTKEDAIRELGIDAKKIVTIGCDVDAFFVKRDICKESELALKSKYGIKEGFILYTGGMDKRKNIEGLIDAYSLLEKKSKERYQLVIVCSISEEQKREIEQYVQRLGIENDRVVMSGHVSDDELAQLYSLCDLFVFASLYEGFGMPILEAMRCGAPVIGSNNSSIREIIEISDAMFDPREPLEMSKKIEEALYDEKLRAKLIENSALQGQKYSIKKSAAKCIEACREAVATRKKNAKSVKKSMGVREKLAYVSPLPPEKTGIADYSAELLFEMVKHYDVTVITNQSDFETQRLPEGLEIQNSAWFLKNSKSFSKVVYHFGNSHFHAYMFALLERCPGVVVSHDFFMSGALGWMDRFGGVHGAYPASLYYSHGYSALLKQKTDAKECGWKYPCNKEILDMSVGVIVHSEYQKRLADDFYGAGYSRAWKTIPLLRKLRGNSDKESARKNLGIESDAFVICSFGFMGVHKLNEKALDAFLKSSLATKPHCKLIFVGAESGDAYCANIIKSIERNKIGDRVSITGFVDNTVYEEYLAAMDIAVQLRTKSRGETSAAVLDVMASKKAVVINAHGTMDDYAEDVCVKLKDTFDEDELSRALERLYEDKTYRDATALRGYEYMERYHTPALVGKMYKEAIEEIYENSRSPKYSKLMDEVVQLGREYKAEDENLKECAVAIAKNFCPQQQTQIFLDVSELVKQDVKTGIQRVVRSLTSELIKNESNRYRVEPVYYQNGTYVYARAFTSTLLGVARTQEDDCEIEYAKGDLFVGLDLSLQESVWAKDRLLKMRLAGVAINFVVYDILPVLHREWWPEGAFGLFSGWLKNIIEISDRLVCISKSTKKDVQRYIEQNSVGNTIPIVDYFHLGADVENSIGSSGITKEQKRVLSSLDFEDTFLMVGTIEPRKGHAEVLEAFEMLWENGENTKLIIIGKQGWMVEKFIDSMKSSKELHKKLFWFNDASDEFLEELYGRCSVLVLASYGEGFGLPIIEAAKHNMPILARDIEVFREVAQEGASYFKGDNAKELCDTIQEWRLKRREGEVISPYGIKYLSWEQSAKWLERLVLE
jgi:glycosyltransferase involved in cell wall biosynthesis